jgi:serine/threonine protein kinase
MELLRGVSLAHRIAGRPLPVREVLELGIELADGLDAGHAQGMLHRDVKPGNIFVTERGQAKLLDFGLAMLPVPPIERLPTYGFRPGAVAKSGLFSPKPAATSCGDGSPRQLRRREPAITTKRNRYRTPSLPPTRSSTNMIASP